MCPSGIRWLVNAQPSIPILTRADGLVVGGSLAACVTAHSLAGRGGRTVLTSSACSVPRETVVCRRPWITEADLRQLPEPFRVILALKYMNAYSCREMAEILDISISAVKSRLFEARKLLRRTTERLAAEKKEDDHGVP